VKSTISSKGQITVPVEVRRRLGLVAGTTVGFEMRPEGVLLRKGSGGPHPVDQVFGLIGPPGAPEGPVREGRAHRTRSLRGRRGSRG
jgi:AbrB family looped-hinge helix DNA binding protein